MVDGIVFWTCHDPKFALQTRGHEVSVSPTSYNLMWNEHGDRNASIGDIDFISLSI